MLRHVLIVSVLVAEILLGYSSFSRQAALDGEETSIGSLRWSSQLHMLVESEMRQCRRSSNRFQALSGAVLESFLPPSNSHVLLATPAISPLPQQDQD